MSTTTTDWLRINADVNASSSKEIIQKTAVPIGYRASPYGDLNPSSYANFNYPTASEGPIDPIENIPTDADFRNGYMIRYLYRQATNLQDSIKETTPDGYESVQGSYLYTATQIRWKIIGKKEDAKKTNLNNAEIAEKSLEGSRSYLTRNLLSYWKDLPDNVQNFDVTNNLKVLQMTPDKRVSAISDIPAIRKELDTEGYADILTQDYEDIIVETRTTI